MIRDNRKLHQTTHYLKILNQNNCFMQPEMRNAIYHALNILEKLDDTAKLEEYLKEVLED